MQKLSAEDGLVILAQQNDQAHAKGKDRTEGEEGCFVGKLVKGVALLDIGPTEAPVAGRNTQPDNESGQTRNIEQPCVGGIFTHQRGNESECADGGGGQHCVDRYAVTRDLCKEARRLPDECHRVQHSRGGVQA